MSSSVDYSPSSSPSFPVAVVDRSLLRATVEARIGRTVDRRYTLTRLLGVGGMGAVYEAVEGDGTRVAIKLLHPAHSDRVDRRKRFLREAYLANAIGHPGMVRIHADGVDDDGSVFLVMELLEGATVRTLQNRAGGRIELSLALRIADQALDVLAAAHASGVTHRDIKPENLFVTHEGRLKVLDFGLAHMRDSVPGMTLRTLPGALLGTPQFMAPEQLLSCGEVDARSDLFALGATLFALLSGEPVRATRTYEPSLQRDTIFAARALRSVWPAAPDAVAAVIDRALRFEPDARWTDAVRMQQALRAAQRNPDARAGGVVRETGRSLDGGGSDSTIMLTTALRASSSRARWRVLAIIAALLALVVVVLFATLGRRPLVIPAAPRPTIAEPVPVRVPALDPTPAAPARTSSAREEIAPARDAVPNGVSEPETMDPPAATRSLGADAPKSKRLTGRRRYDRVANDIVDPWE